MINVLLTVSIDLSLNQVSSKTCRYIPHTEATQFFQVTVSKSFTHHYQEQLKVADEVVLNEEGPRKDRQTYYIHFVPRPVLKLPSGQYHLVFLC